MGLLGGTVEVVSARLSQGRAISPRPSVLAGSSTRLLDATWAFQEGTHTGLSSDGKAVVDPLRVQSYSITCSVLEGECVSVDENDESNIPHQGNCRDRPVRIRVHVPSGVANVVGDWGDRIGAAVQHVETHVCGRIEMRETRA